MLICRFGVILLVFNFSQSSLVVFIVDIVSFSLIPLHHLNFLQIFVIVLLSFCRHLLVLYLNQLIIASKHFHPIVSFIFSCI